MAKDRGVACKSYINEKNCRKGREGTFFSYCQHCDAYDPVRGGKNIKPNLKRQKMEKLKKDKRNW